jgi:hypothetical protein
MVYSASTPQQANLGSLNSQTMAYRRPASFHAEIPSHQVNLTDRFDYSDRRPSSFTAPKPADKGMKFGGKMGAITGSVIGGVLGGIAAGMIGIPSLILGIFIHPLLLVALASPLLIPIGMLIGAKMGGSDDGHKKSH